MNSIFSAIKSRLSFKKVAFVIILNSISILILILFLNYFEKKKEKVFIKFEAFNKINNIYARIGPEIRFKNINEEIAELIGDYLFKNYKVEQLDYVNKEKKNTLNEGTISVIISSTVKSKQYFQKSKLLEKEKLMFDLKKLLKNDLENIRKKVLISEKNTKALNDFYLRKLDEEYNLSENLKGRIQSIMNANNLTFLQNQHLLELINIYEKFLQNEFSNSFNLKIDQEIKKMNTFEYFELLFAYLIIINAITLICFKYYRAKI